MIADSINSAGDIFASLMAFIGNKIASVPKDENHNFGHGKAEYLFSLFIAISMILLSVKTIIDAISTLINGSYHNIFRVGAILQDLGFWILNDIVWVKTNPMPNFRGTRFTNAHETLIWATPRKTGKYTFNYETMKKLNGGKQMRSDWNINICLGEERVKGANGKSLHNTQKPLDLLRRVILASTRAGDVILDPFMGSGTTAAAAKELGRNFIGIERDESYVAAARARVDAVQPIDLSDIEVTAPKRDEVRVAFKELIEAGLLYVGQTLVSPRGERVMITRDGQLTHTLYGKASIHVMAARLQHSVSFNGWDYWSAERRDGTLVAIDDLRKYVRGIKRDMKKVA